MSNLPSYLAAAKPVPLANRAPWYKTITPAYIGVMLWFVFWQDLVTGGAGKDVHSGRSACERLLLPLPRPGHCRGDLPFLLLSGAGPVGHENRPAAVRGGHVDLRRPRRAVHARLPDGLAPVRLAGRQRLHRGQGPLHVLRCRHESRRPRGHRAQLAARNHRGGVRHPGGVHRTEGHQVRGPRGDLLAADPRAGVVGPVGDHLHRTRQLQPGHAQRRRAPANCRNSRRPGATGRSWQSSASTSWGSSPPPARRASTSPRTAAAWKTCISAESWESSCPPCWPAR